MDYNWCMQDVGGSEQCTETSENPSVDKYA